MKTKIYAMLYILIIFLDPVYYCIMTILQSEALLLGPVVFGTSVTSIILFLILHKSITKREFLCFVGLAVFGLIFYMTSEFYGYREDKYWSLFLKWLSLGNTSVLVGMTLGKLTVCGKVNLFNQIFKYLPFLNIVLTLIISSRLMLGKDTDNGQFQDNFGLGYQSMAYYLALLFSCNMFSCFVHKNNFKMPFLIKSVIYLSMVLQIVLCAMSGGRGGLVLIVIYGLFYIRYLNRSRVINKKSLFALLLISTVLFLVFASYFDMWNSAGYNRSTGRFSDNSRTDLWVTFLPLILDNILGHGIGSDFYLIEGYTHNIILDFLVEAGIFGAIILLFVYYKVFHILYKSIFHNEYSFFILTLFIYSFVYNFFSGYWPTGQYNWLALGFVISITTINNKKSLQ